MEYVLKGNVPKIVDNLEKVGTHLPRLPCSWAHPGDIFLSLYSPHRALIPIFRILTAMKHP
jgi:hypothetical protein